MKNSKKKILLVALFSVIVSFSCLNAQISCDPTSNFYIMAQGWELRNVIEHTPSLRPYPLQIIKSIIEQVMDNGTETDKKIAEEYYAYIFGKQWNVELEAKDNLNIVYGDSNTGNQLLINPSFQGDASIIPNFISVGYKIGLYNTTANSYNFIPLFQNINYDAIHFYADIGPFESYLNANTCVAVGNKNLYIQTGVYRTGFGNYIGEGLVLNDSAYHTANFSFNLNKDKWAYSQQISVLGATTNTGTGLEANKFLSFHALDFYWHPKFTFTYYESIVYGNRFDPSYLFPSPYIVTQGITGDQDNLQMGVVFSYKPFSGFAWDTDIFVDDLSVNELIKLNIDSKNRIAAKTGVIYTPVNSLCSRLAVDYTMITPYTYSHWDYNDTSDKIITKDTINYQNCTNNGISLGSSYPPNSDRLYFSMDLHPFPRLNLEVTSSFMRHANVCESLTDSEAMEYLKANEGIYSTDGSVFTNSMMSEGKQVDTAWNHLNFLTQPNKMYIIQAGVSGSYSLKRFNWGQVSFKLSYNFEYIYNKGVDSDLYEGGATQNNDGTWNWHKKSNLTESELVAAAKSEWISGFHDVMENFISLGIVFTY